MISVSIIAKDKSVILPSCLESVRQVFDDVVIVTNADHKFINYADQKNYAASKCKYDWVLSLDADEELSPELIHELRTMNHELYAAFKIPRLNIIFGRPMFHTNWEPSADTHIWLYDKTKCKWEGNVHEEVVANGPVGTLRARKIHHSYQTVEEFMDKMNNYTSRETKIVNPLFDFLRRYIWHKGFLDGWHGLFLSYLMAVYHTVTWVKKNSS
ncbi:MAG: glycosyltransferase family 2 protein [Patescibacteria group bacterium]